MKNLIALFCVASAVTAFADDTPATSDNVFGVLRVDSSAVETIVAVPWVGAGSTDGKIAVTDVVKTANLNAGDKLYYYDGNEYKMWELSEGKQWVPSQSQQGEMPPAKLDRGGAIILVRTAPIASCFYLYGQYKSETGVKTLLPANAFSLIAPPKTIGTDDGKIDLNDSSVTWEGITAADHVILPSGKQLDWAENSWGVRTYKDKDDFEGDWSKVDAKIPMGQGVWFKAGDGEGKSVTW